MKNLTSITNSYFRNMHSVEWLKGQTKKAKSHPESNLYQHLKPGNFSPKPISIALALETMWNCTKTTSPHNVESPTTKYATAHESMDKVMKLLHKGLRSNSLQHYLITGKKRTKACSLHSIKRTKLYGCLGNVICRIQITTNFPGHIPKTIIIVRIVKVLCTEQTRVLIPVSIENRYLYHALNKTAWDPIWSIP